jgi:exopolyphosphatase/guanosine-5'-triphosphate,3'-diphosphate pyrophosphatase
MFSPEPDEPTFDAMLGYVQTLLAPVEQAERFQALMEGGRLQILGTSGTVTTLAAVLLDLRRYDRNAIDGLVVDPLAISDVSQKLRGMTNASRMAHPCIGNGRAALVVAGCVILGAILRFWPADTLRVADRGLREGILHSLMGRSLETELGAVESPLPSPPPSHGAVS